MRRRLKRAPKIAGIPLSKNTFNSLTRAAKDIITNKKASDDERIRRETICHKCPERKRDRCGLCGCFLKSKISLLNSECPIGKWSTLISKSAIDDAGSTETNKECADNPT